MAKKDGVYTMGTTSMIKVNTDVLDRVKKQKRDTGVTIQKFFSIAADEKLKKKNPQKIWEFLVAKLTAAGVNDNNLTARKIYDYIK